MPNLYDDGNPLAARPDVSHLGLRDWWVVGFHGEAQNGLTPEHTAPMTDGESPIAVWG